MNTPITDIVAYDVEESRGSTREILRKSGLHVDADVARRLELDRAALMEALRQISIPRSASMISRPWDEIARLSEIAASALIAARANFP